MIKTLSKSRSTSALKLPSRNYSIAAVSAKSASAATIAALAPVATPPIVPAFDQSLWLNPPADLKLETNEAHIWAMRIDAENVWQVSELLSPDERARAARFHFERDRRRYMASRGVLRVLLGDYLQIAAEKIRFEYGEFGKPAVSGEKEIKFNLSHSGDVALFSFTRQREIGVDIEQIKPDCINQAMLDQTLTEQEKNFYYALSVESRSEFFFECWTRKEAYMKACGLGLTLSPCEIETLSFTNESFDAGAGYRPSGWSIRSVPFVPDNVKAALAIEGDYCPRLRFWQRSKHIAQL